MTTMPDHFVHHIVWIARFGAGALGVIAFVIAVTCIRAVMANWRWSRVQEEQDRARRLRRYPNS